MGNPSPAAPLPRGERGEVGTDDGTRDVSLRQVRGTPGSAGLAATDGYTCTLDHDGCVVCSDAGIPVRVVALDGDDALCEDAAGTRATIAVELVAPVTPGDILLTHGGVAIGRGNALLEEGEDDLEVRA